MLTAKPTGTLVQTCPDLERSLQPPVTPLGKLNNVPDLPPHFLPRPEHLEPLKATVLADADKPVVLTGTTRKKVGVQGMGGIGKSVLAAALARDDDVRRAFPDGVLWVTLGQTPALTTRQTQIADALEREPHAFMDVQQGRARLSELLADKGCLLILDDVWDAQHVRPFDALGPRCRMLITTRDAGLIAALGATERRLDVLDAEQALKLLAEWAGVGQDAILPNEANEVAQECGNLPLALALSAAQVYGGTPWDDLLDALREADLEFLDHPHGSVIKSLRVSVDALPIDQARRYLELAVFPADEAVPEAAVLTLWLHASDLKARNARKLLTTLERKALLRLEGQAPQRRVSLHDLQYDYVRKQVSEPGDQVGASGAARREHLAHLHQALDTHFNAEELKTLCLHLGVDYDNLPAMGKDNKARELVQYLKRQKRIPELLKIGMRIRPDVAWGLPDPSPGGLLALHQRLLDAYAACCPAGWPSGPDDGYYFQHLGNHLMQAGRADELRELLLDFHWLQVKLETTDAADLIADYELLSDDAELRLVQGAIRLSAHVLAQDKAGLWSQLYGRLMAHDAPAIQAILALWPKTPWLRPLVPSLTPPGSPLLRTLTGHTSWVKAVVVTPDGRRAVSASSDKTLKVWDLERGQELRTLTGHSGQIISVAVTPDGRRAVSASEDHTLKVWDISPELNTSLERGEALRTLTGHSKVVYAVAVTPDGRRAVFASLDRTLKVWDLEWGEALRTLTGHTSWVRAVAVTPDGRRAVSASRDKTLKVWDISPELNTSLERGQELRTLTGRAIAFIFGRVYSRPPMKPVNLGGTQCSKRPQVQSLNTLQN